jgi:5'-nucleotidase
MKRRQFIQRIGIGTVLAGSGILSPEVFANPKTFKLTILHTNDTHSRIDPFPMDGGTNQGLGGVAKRAALINKIRKEEPNVLLLDSGDIFQGTPYFNLFGGEIEFKAMSAMGYDASTMGNHDFDGGLEGFVKQLPHATFPFICSNYDFSETLAHEKTVDYKIFNRGKLKIGVFGLGIELDGLVPKNSFGKTRYLDPIERAKHFSNLLKNEMKCDLVICLSHLGYKYNNQKLSDIVLAENTENIDIILGGHTHTFLNKPDVRLNSKSQKVVINQVGFAGIILGRLDIYFEKNKKDVCISCNNHEVNNIID